MNKLDTFVLTPGEPAGIGPDLAVMLAQETLPCNMIVVADPEVLSARAARLNLPLCIQTFSSADNGNHHQPSHLVVYPEITHSHVIPGQLNKNNSPYVLKTLETAVKLCQENTCQALVTGPVHKAIINEAGLPFTGHTEFLAKLTQAYPVMMLSCEQLKVALATTHLPLSAVPAAITSELLETVISILLNDLRHRFKINQPKIYVCGLNPHAGENGHLGSEELETIIPVVEKFQYQGEKIIGPLPADTIFIPKYMQDADVFLAMYHDQGLPVLKHLGFSKAVNITLGLPIIRVSVDHGTALDLAGTGNITLNSLQAAIQTARQMM